MRISDWSSDVCSSDLSSTRLCHRNNSPKSASTCNSNEHWVTMPSRRRSKRRPDASLLPGLPIAHADGWKQQELKYTWPCSCSSLKIVRASWREIVGQEV